eukprot:g203.t1
MTQLPSGNSVRGEQRHKDTGISEGFLHGVSKLDLGAFDDASEQLGTLDDDTICLAPLNTACGTLDEASASWSPGGSGSSGSEDNKGNVEDGGHQTAGSHRGGADTAEPRSINLKSGTFEFGQLCGRGGSADVYQIYKGGQRYAVKVANLKKCSAQGKEALSRELEILKSLGASQDGADRPCVKMHAHCVMDDFSYLFMECADTDFQKYWEYHVGKSCATCDAQRGMSLERIKHCWPQMVRACEYVHSKGVIHFDVKPANFLVFCDGARAVDDAAVDMEAGNVRIKITDFGIAASFATRHHAKMENKVDLHAGTHVSRDHLEAGTLSYLAPESIFQPEAMEAESMKLRPSVDIWALGIILYQCFYNETPFSKIPSSRVAFAINDPRMEIQYPSLRKRFEELVAESQSQTCRGFSVDACSPVADMAFPNEAQCEEEEVLAEAESSRKKRAEALEEGVPPESVFEPAATTGCSVLCSCLASSVALWIVTVLVVAGIGCAVGVPLAMLKGQDGWDGSGGDGGLVDDGGGGDDVGAPGGGGGGRFGASSWGRNTRIRRIRVFRPQDDAPAMLKERPGRIRVFRPQDVDAPMGLKANPDWHGGGGPPGGDDGPMPPFFRGHGGGADRGEGRPGVPWRRGPDEEDLDDDAPHINVVKAGRKKTKPPQPKIFLLAAPAKAKPKNRKRGAGWWKWGQRLPEAPHLFTQEARPERIPLLQADAPEEVAPPQLVDLPEEVSVLQRPLFSPQCPESEEVATLEILEPEPDTTARRQSRTQNSSNVEDSESDSSSAVSSVLHPPAEVAQLLPDTEEIIPAPEDEEPAAPPESLEEEEERVPMFIGPHTVPAAASAAAPAEAAEDDERVPTAFERAQPVVETAQLAEKELILIPFPKPHAPVALPEALEEEEERVPMLNRPEPDAAAAAPPQPADNQEEVPTAFERAQPVVETAQPAEEELIPFPKPQAPAAPPEPLEEEEERVPVFAGPHTVPAAASAAAPAEAAEDDERVPTAFERAQPVVETAQLAEKELILIPFPKPHAPVALPEALEEEEERVPMLNRPEPDAAAAAPPQPADNQEEVPTAFERAQPVVETAQPAEEELIPFPKPHAPAALPEALEEEEERVPMFIRPVAAAAAPPQPADNQEEAPTDFERAQPVAEVGQPDNEEVIPCPRTTAPAVPPEPQEQAQEDQEGERVTLKETPPVQQLLVSLSQGDQAVVVTEGADGAQNTTAENVEDEQTKTFLELLTSKYWDAEPTDRRVVVLSKEEAKKVYPKPPALPEAMAKEKGKGPSALPTLPPEPKSVLFVALRKLHRWLRREDQDHRTMPGDEEFLAGDEKNFLEKVDVKVLAKKAAAFLKRVQKARKGSSADRVQLLRPANWGAVTRRLPMLPLSCEGVPAWVLPVWHVFLRQPQVVARLRQNCGAAALFDADPLFDACKTFDALFMRTPVSSRQGPHVWDWGTEDRRTGRERCVALKAAFEDKVRGDEDEGEGASLDASADASRAMNDLSRRLLGKHGEGGVPLSSHEDDEFVEGEPEDEDDARMWQLVWPIADANESQDEIEQRARTERFGSRASINADSELNVFSEFAAAGPPAGEESSSEVMPSFHGWSVIIEHPDSVLAALRRNLLSRKLWDATKDRADWVAVALAIEGSHGNASGEHAFPGLLQITLDDRCAPTVHEISGAPAEQDDRSKLPKALHFATRTTQSSRDFAVIEDIAEYAAELKTQGHDAATYVQSPDLEQQRVTYELEAVIYKFPSGTLEPAESTAPRRQNARRPWTWQEQAVRGSNRGRAAATLFRGRAAATDPERSDLRMEYAVAVRDSTNFEGGLVFSNKSQQRTLQGTDYGAEAEAIEERIRKLGGAPWKLLYKKQELHKFSDAWRPGGSPAVFFNGVAEVADATAKLHTAVENQGHEGAPPLAAGESSEADIAISEARLMLVDRKVDTETSSLNPGVKTSDYVDALLLRLESYERAGKSWFRESTASLELQERHEDARAGENRAFAKDFSRGLLDVQAGLHQISEMLEKQDARRMEREGIWNVVEARAQEFAAELAKLELLEKKSMLEQVSYRVIRDGVAVTATDPDTTKVQGMLERFSEAWRDSERGAPGASGSRDDPPTRSGAPGADEGDEEDEEKNDELKLFFTSVWQHNARLEDPKDSAIVKVLVTMHSFLDNEMAEVKARLRNQPPPLQLQIARSETDTSFWRKLDLGALAAGVAAFAESLQERMNGCKDTDYDAASLTLPAGLSQSGSGFGLLFPGNWAAWESSPGEEFLCTF